mmetsp:Transcript_17428/g.16892  ORF Transcript_17428/g.16892 Transcript_17428/m.16892 type:complete len:252 (+) Transcript_17428:468-1223(+)
MKFTKVSGIHSFITEHTINRKILLWFESSFLICQLVKHLRRNSSCMCTKKIFKGLFFFEIVSVADGSRTSNFMHGFDPFVVVLGHGDGRCGFFDEEGVMCITGRMGLWLEKRIKVPERGFDPLVGGHFIESHLHQYFTKFGTNFEEGVKISSSYLLTQSQEIVWFECCGLPRSRIQHFFGQVRCLLDTSGSISWPPTYLKRLNCHKRHKFPTFQCRNHFAIHIIWISIRFLQVHQCLLILIPYIFHSLDCH